MARPWQVPRPLLAILVALVAFTYQAGKKTFKSVQEVTPVEPYVSNTLQYVSDAYNSGSKDEFTFRILRILKLLKQVTDHLEYHITLEFQRTTCRKPEKDNCAFQEGESHKPIQCYYSVFAIPWIEKYKILKKNCSDG